MITRIFTVCLLIFASACYGGNDDVNDEDVLNLVNHYITSKNEVTIHVVNHFLYRLRVSAILHTCDMKGLSTQILPAKDEVAKVAKDKITDMLLNEATERRPVYLTLDKNARAILGATVYNSLMHVYIGLTEAFKLTILDTKNDSLCDLAIEEADKISRK